jgi:hypothetical protein
MKHLFVPIELALLAKEKGFDEPCISNYVSGTDVLGNNLVNHLEMWSDEDLETIYSSTKAPIYQQLIDWFREKHNLNIPIYYSLVDGKYNSHCYCSFDKERETDVVYDTDYYGCLNKALVEAFKLI